MHGSGRPPASPAGGNAGAEVAAFLSGASAPAADDEQPYEDGYGPEFTASYDGRCAADCGEWIDAGDPIRADGDGGYVHSECADD